MDIQKMLKSYKEKKAVVDATHARIAAWERILLDPNIEFYGYKLYNREIGMPSAHSATSQVEREAFANNENDDVTKELLEEWIKEDRSRIAPIEIEVEQVEHALKALTEQERYIINLKYFEGLFWANIEISFNKQYPNKQDVTEERLRQMHKEAKSKLEYVLNPYCSKVT